MTLTIAAINATFRTMQDAVTVNLNIHHITEAQAARVLDLMQEIAQ